MIWYFVDLWIQFRVCLVEHRINSIDANQSGEFHYQNDEEGDLAWICITKGILIQMHYVDGLFLAVPL